jgi:hypothetical protein
VGDRASEIQLSRRQVVSGAAVFGGAVAVDLLNPATLAAKELLCQRSAGSAHRRPVEVPSGGHQKRPLAASRPPSGHHARRYRVMGIAVQMESARGERACGGSDAILAPQGDSGGIWAIGGTSSGRTVGR